MSAEENRTRKKCLLNRSVIECSASEWEFVFYKKKKLREQNLLFFFLIFPRGNFEKSNFIFSNISINVRFGYILLLLLYALFVRLVFSNRSIRVLGTRIPTEYDLWNV